MAKKPEEILAALQKQKEDIEILLSTVEDAYAEAGITEKHYNEVKTKNQKRLKEIESKIKAIERKAGREAKKEERKAKREEAKEEKVAEKKPKTVGEMIEAEQGPIPISEPIGGEMPEEPTTEIPEPTTTPAVSAKPGEARFNADEIKNMLSRFIKEIRPGGLEVLPKVEKMEVRLEKMGAFLDAIRDEKSSRDETIRRLTEEIGEIRSSIGSLDRKISQQEIMVSDISTSIVDLKPQRFIRFLRKSDMQLKMHDTKIQRMEDLTNIMMKRITTVEDVLKKIGSLEKIADFGRDIAKRLIEIENREKRIGRVSERIDTIFMELNKRLDEFILYKAKQDTLDELSREMMKAIDDMNTRIEGLAKKEDLEIFRDTMESRISGVGGAGPAVLSPEVKKLQEEKEEIESLLTILEEQFKKGDIKKGEYEKTKAINMERLESIERKIQEKPQELTGVPAPIEETEAPEPQPSAEEAEGLEEKPMEEKPAGKPGVKEKKVAEKKPARRKSRKEEMLDELGDSYRRGEISKKAYERAKKMIEGGK
jgi:hypothetical protein